MTLFIYGTYVIKNVLKSDHGLGDAKMQDDTIKSYILESVFAKKPDEGLVTRFGGLANKVTNEHGRNGQKSRRPSTYRVTDLINPMQAYMSIKNQDIEDPKELRQLFAYGNLVEQKLISILKKNKKFASYQGKC